MRVLLVSHHFPPDAIGGVERITQALASDLVALGNNISIVTRRFNAETVVQTLRESAADNITIYRLSGGYFSNETFLQYHRQLETQFTQIVHDTAPDIVHILHLRGLSPRFVEIAREHGAAIVISLQDFYFACPRITLLNTRGEWCAGPMGGTRCATTCFANEGANAERWTLRAQYWNETLKRAQRFICPSQYMADFFQGQDVDATRMRVIPNGVSLEPPELWEQDTATAPRTALRLLFLGTVVPHKGVHLILDALEQVAVGAVDLVIAGSLTDAAYTQRLRAQAAKIPNLRVRFFGGYEMDELPWLLRDVDCVITPSAWQEAFGIVTREALRRGIPVIVSRVGGLGEAVEEGVNGFTFAPEHPEELGELLQRLAHEEGLLTRLQDGARATNVLTTREHAQAVRAVYGQAQAAAQGQSFSPDQEMTALFDQLHTAFAGE